MISFSDAVSYSRVVASRFPHPQIEGVLAEKNAVLRCMIKKDYGDLISLTTADRGVFDEVLLLCANGIEGNCLPNQLSQWLVKVLRGQVDYPSGKRGAPSKSINTSMVIGLLRDLVSSGMTATRGDVSEATSACDAVAIALNVTFDRVKDIWEQRMDPLE